MADTDEKTQAQVRSKMSSMAFPQDIKVPWLNVARRFQSVARTGGLALITMTVLVDQDGLPRLWLEPDCRKIEPRRSAEEIIKMLTSKPGFKKL
jgi:hypothetical protein